MKAWLFSALLILGASQPLLAQAIYTPLRFTTVAGSVGTAGEVDGTGSAAQFSSPYGMAVDGSGNIYVTDEIGNTIRQITPAGVVTTLAGSPGVTGSSDGVGSSAQFNHPYGIAVDLSGNLYVADTYNCTIRKIIPTVVGGTTTWTVTTFAGDAANASSAAAFGHDDGTGTAASFFDPTSVAVDGSGNVYVADSENYDIRKITPGGVVTTLAGVPENPGDTDGTGSDARFDRPTGVAVDGSGNVYVSDTVNNLIREISPAGAVTTLAGIYGAGIYGSRPYIDGNVSVAQFTEPAGIAVDGSGNLYIADPVEDTVRKLTPAGELTTVGGVPDVRGSTNGTGANAKFNSPFYVAVDAGGNVYVSDAGNDTIRKGSAPAVAPTFTLAASPATAAVATGRTVVFNAIATGTPAPTYQWTLNGSATIPGATVTNDPVLLITGATASDAGTITCTAVNSAGSVSTTATLTVVTTGSPGYLTNLSGRGVVGAGVVNALFGGFGIAGSGSKNLLIRGIGPSGTIVGVPAGTELMSTQVALYYNGSIIAQNSPWGGTATLANAEAAVGAYTIPDNSLDSMLYLPEPPQTYSAEVGGAGNYTGIAEVELYDADTPPADLPAGQPLGAGPRRHGQQHSLRRLLHRRNHPRGDSHPRHGPQPGHCLPRFIYPFGRARPARPDALPGRHGALFQYGLGRRPGLVGSRKCRGRLHQFSELIPGFDAAGLPSARQLHDPDHRGQLHHRHRRGRDLRSAVTPIKA